MPHFRDLPVARNWQIRLAESNISGSRVLVGRNNNLFANVINNVGKQGLDGRSEIVLEFKRLGGYGDNECLRTGMKNGLRVSEQSGNVEVVSDRVAGHRAWLYVFTSPCAGFSHIRSVYENNQLGLADGLGELRCQLMHGQNVGGFVPE